MLLHDELQQSLGTGYTLEQELGGGGMSRVFVARDLTLRRDVVVKVLPPELIAGVNVERFRREILVAAGLQNPHIVPVLTAGEMDGVPWFTMPYVQGEALRARIARGPMPIAEVVSILRDVSKALVYAHERGVVHRDIKPDNVLLSGGTAVVTDFGIAKALSASRARDDPHNTRGPLTQRGVSIGTPSYMSPEQAAADPDADARADLYSLGCMAYELLVGHPPFAGLSPQKLLAAHMAEPPRPLLEVRHDAPPLLGELVMSCLEKDPARRPSSAAVVLHLLDAVASPNRGATTASVILPPRVSLGAAVGVWAGVFLAAWLLAKAAIVIIGLPTWVVPGAMIVAAFGLPAIVLTAVVQGTAHRASVRMPTLTPGGTQNTRSTMATLAMKASPHVNWKRTTRGGVVAFSVFALAVAAFMAMRAFGIGPAGSLLGAGVLGDRDLLLIADFSFAGTDSLLGRAVTEAIRTDLGQSNVMRLVPASVVNQTLALMQKPAGTHVDTGVARGIAIRSGVKAVLGGDIVPLGASYVLTAHLIAPSTGDVLAAFRETAADQRDLVPAVERLSRALRAKVGESLRRIQANPPLVGVTTTSLDALRQYAQGIHQGDDLGDVAGGTALLLSAVQKDSTFATAWRKLGAWANNAGDPHAETYARRASENANHLPAAEGQGAIASYHITFGDGYDPGAAIDAYRKVIELDSANTTAMVNSGIVLTSLGQLDSAKRLYVRAASVNAYALYHLALIDVEMGHPREGDSVRAIAHQRAPGFPYRSMFDAVRLYLLGKYDSAVVVSRNGNPATRRVLAHVAMSVGRHAEARGALEGMIDHAATIGDVGTALDAIATISLMESLARNDRVKALAVVRNGERRFPLLSTPLSRRPYYQLAAAYAAAGDPARAEQLAAEAERGFSRGLRLWNREPAMIAIGLIAMTKGKPRDAVAALSAPVYCGGSASRNLGGAGTTVRCPSPFLAEAYDRLGEADSARVTYERYVNTPFMPRMLTDGLVLAASFQRLGELYEARGDPQTAARYYGRMADLWEHADAELQPRVEEMRRRSARLRDSARE